MSGWDGSTLILPLQNLGKLAELVTAWIACREMIMALFLIGLKTRVEGLTTGKVGSYR